MTKMIFGTGDEVEFSPSADGKNLKGVVTAMKASGISVKATLEKGGEKTYVVAQSQIILPEESKWKKV